MSGAFFDLLSQGMRYWFVGLVVYILFRLVTSVWREFSREKDESRLSSGEYAVGILTVVEASENSKLLGQRFSLRQENKIGRSSSCDIRIKDRSLMPVQALIYQKGKQLVLSDYGTRAGVGLNGHRIKEDVALLDGDEVQLSNVVLALRIEGGVQRNRLENRNKQNYNSEGKRSRHSDYQDQNRSSSARRGEYLEEQNYGDEFVEDEDDDGHDSDANYDEDDEYDPDADYDEDDDEYDPDMDYDDEYDPVDDYDPEYDENDGEEWRWR